MELHLVIAAIGLLVFLAHLFVALFERTRVPDVLYLVLIGVVLGPIAGLVSPADFGKVGGVFTAVALVVILFEGGLELNIDLLRTSLRGTLISAVVGYLAAFVILAAAMIWLLRFPPGLSIFASAVLAGPAPAVVIPLARQLRLSPAMNTRLMLESPLGEALCIIVALAIMDAIQSDTLHVGKTLGGLFASFIFALAIGFAGGFLWSILLHRIRQLRYAIFTTPAFLLILYGVTEFLGYSGAVTALTFGITLGNIGGKELRWVSARYGLTPLQHDDTEKAFFGEIVFLVKTFFFVYLGLSLPLTDLWVLSSAGLLTLALLLARYLSTQLTVRRLEAGRADAFIMSVIVPRGTAAAVLASIPVQLGWEGAAYLQTIMYAVVVISILTSGLLVFLADRTRISDFLSFLFPGYSPSGNQPQPETAQGRNPTEN